MAEAQHVIEQPCTGLLLPTGQLDGKQIGFDSHVKVEVYPSNSPVA